MFDSWVWNRLFVELGAVPAQDRSSVWALAHTMLANGADTDDENPLAVWYVPLGLEPGADLWEMSRAIRGRLRVVPPVVLRSEAELRAEVEQADLLTRLELLVSFVGPGQRLTRAGNLPLADGRELAELVGPWEMAREGMLHADQARSTRALPGVDLLVQVAVGAGFLQRTAGRLTVTERDAGLGADPLQDLAAAVDALVAAGPLTLCDGRQPPLWCDRLDGSVPMLLEWLYRAGGELAVYWVALWMGWLVIGDQHPDHPWRYPDHPWHMGRGWELQGTLVARDVARLVNVLGAAGILRWHVADDEEAPLRVELTDVGRWYTHRRLRSAGYDAPVAGHLADHDASELVQAVAGYVPLAAALEVRTWMTRRGPGGLAELDAAAARVPGAAIRLAVAAALDAGTVDAEPTARRWAADPLLGPHARIWLAAAGLEPPETVTSTDRSSVLVDTLSAALDHLPPLMIPGLMDHFDLLDRLLLLGHMPDLDHPDANRVLHALAENAADRFVATTARHGLQQRTAASN